MPNERFIGVAWMDRSLLCHTFPCGKSKREVHSGTGTRIGKSRKEDRPRAPKMGRVYGPIGLRTPRPFCFRHVA